MNEYIAPLILLIVLFVGFGLANRGKQSGGGCADCTGTDCSNKNECSKEDQPNHS